MIVIRTEEDAKVYEAVGQMASRVCGLEHVEIVAEFKRRLVEAIDAANKAREETQAKLTDDV